MNGSCNRLTGLQSGVESTHMFNFFRKNKPQNIIAAAIISAAALVGMIDAFYLLLEFIQVLLHPGEPTPCTVNTIVSCTLTVQGKYGHYFPGIPNPMWGMLWYAGCLGYGVTRLFGSSFSRPARMFVATVMRPGCPAWAIRTAAPFPANPSMRASTVSPLASAMT